MYKNKRCLFYIFSLNALHSGLPLSVLTSAWTVITLQWLVSKVSCFIHFQIFFFFFVPDSSEGASQGTLSKKNFNKVFFFRKNYLSPENGIFGPLLTASYKNSQSCLSAKNGSLWALHVLKERSQARGAVSEPSQPFATPQRDGFQKGTSPCPLSDRKARN